MAERKLEELNLIDDFLFNAVMAYPDFGEEFGRKLLKLLFNKEMKYVRVTSQRYFASVDKDLKGARVDLLLEVDDIAELSPELEATLYEVEPDQNSGSNKVRVLPKRVRYYHAIIDDRSLKSGEEPKNLKNVIVIFICSYDPDLVYGSESMYRRTGCSIRRWSENDFSIHQRNERPGVRRCTSVLALHGE